MQNCPQNSNWPPSCWVQVMAAVDFFFELGVIHIPTKCQTEGLCLKYNSWNKRKILIVAIHSCLCSSQDGGADFSAWSAQQFWGTVQCSSGRVSDHSCPRPSAGVVNAGAAQCGQTTVGLQWKTDSQCGQKLEEGGTAELRGAEVMDGMDSRWRMFTLTSRTFHDISFKSGQGMWVSMPFFFLEVVVISSLLKCCLIVRPSSLPSTTMMLVLLFVTCLTYAK